MEIWCKRGKVLPQMGNFSSNYRDLRVREGFGLACVIAIAKADNFIMRAIIRAKHFDKHIGKL